MSLIEPADFRKWMSVFKVATGGGPGGEVTLQNAYDSGNIIQETTGRAVEIISTASDGGNQLLYVSDKGTSVHLPIYSLLSASLNITPDLIDTIFQNSGATLTCTLNVILEGSGTNYSQNSSFFVWSNGTHNIQVQMASGVILNGINAGNLTILPGQAWVLYRLSQNTWGSFNLQPSAGTGINYTNGVISIIDSDVVTSLNSLTDDVILAAGSGVNLVTTGNTITANTVVNTWNGGNSAIDVTAGSGIDITGGVISLTGTGPSSAYATYFTTANTDAISFTDASTYKTIVVSNVESQANNFVVGTDINGSPYAQYIGADAGDFEINVTCILRTQTNTSPNSFNMSIGRNGATPIYGGNNYIQFNTNGNMDLDSVYIPFTTQMTLNPNDSIYILIKNRGDLSPTNNAIIPTYVLFTVQKVGDTGGSSSGVTSLNGLLGDLNITSADGSVSINPSGANVNLSINKYITVTGTSQTILANKNYIATNSSLTTFTLPNSLCPAGSVIKISGYGSGLFSLAQSVGQRIFFGTDSTTLGVSGHLDSVYANSALELVCTTDNTIFMVVSDQGQTFNTI